MNIEEIDLDNLDDTDTYSVNKFDGPGRGRKQCPNCKSYIGCKLTLCECGHSFSGKAGIKINPYLKEEDKEPISEDILKYISGISPNGKFIVVYAAAGKCPFILSEYDKKTVYTFCHDVIDAGLSIKKLYLPQVIKSWLRSQVAFEKQKDVLNLVDNWYKDILNEANN